MGLDNIIGNERIKEYIRQAVSHKKVSHAYIIEGEKGSGKKLITDAFVSLLGVDAPDIIRVTHEKPNNISVDEIREQVINTIDIKPYKYDYKVYIIDEAEKMGIPAQNAILKTVEDPPSYGLLFLLTTSKGALLETIISRCVCLQTRPIPDRELEDYLIAACLLSEEEARFAAGYAMGNIGKAKNVAESELFQEMKEDMISLLRQLDQSSLYQLSGPIKKLGKYKDHFNDLMDITILWYRDLLMVLSGLPDQIVLQGEYESLYRQSKKISPLSVNLAFDRIQLARDRFKANVNYEASLEMMFIQMCRDFMTNSF